MEPWIDYELPADLIAQEPLPNRVDARLLVVDRQRQTLEHRHVRDLPELLRRDDQLVLNNTRVVPAQLQGRRLGTGGKWQGLFLHANPDKTWTIVCKTRGTLRPPEPVMLVDRDGRDALKLWLVEKLSDGQWLARPESEEGHFALLERIGRVPLPPYIRGGQMVDSDIARYQTVFASRPGAVAAPTAGLHLTESLLKTIHARGVGVSAVTLHVGLGTFRPVTVEDPAQHEMHSEWAEVTSPAVAEIERARAAGGRIVAVGTTVARVLETVAGEAAAAGSDTLLQAWSGETSIFIRPPHEFRAVDALLTNFHFPRTTLLLLVQALAGSALLRQAYETAVAQRYRFYSYGDAMLIV
ncbi:MAG: tRNA preQ1(34) S-adenosylmethionine ribosyltransferase-isomerase QueA [Planctomycetales bacterium]|nr:tRNA preQ1(34) S-adenosylmethionine ribosyltransferase-isomerase QueA [Planctomycetales bacterium]